MILIDDRIGSKDLAAPLRRAGLDVAVVRLPFADVAFEGKGNAGTVVNVGIELKRLTDLCSSLRSGRLSGHQNPGLQQVYDYRWLVVEGEYGADRQGHLLTRKRGHMTSLRGQMSLDEVEGRLLTLELETGLHIRHTSSRWQTLRFIARLYRWWTDVAKDQHQSHLVAHTPASILPMSAMRQVLCMIPRVGRQASLAAERMFKTPIRAMTATVDEWAALELGEKRLGRKAAEGIVRFCRGGE